MTSPTSLYKMAVDKVRTGGVAVTAMFGPVAGGFIENPASAEAQGLDTVEVIYVDIVGEATLGDVETSIPIQPGQRFTVVPGQTTNLSVNAASSGHRFSGVVLQPPTPYPPAPQPGTFPPSGPTTMTEIIPAYLYEQYADDEDLQAFFAAYNETGQTYMAWFATIGLPVYTAPQIAGALLDWVALGLYGMPRPSLSSGRNRNLGPLNTYAFNVLPLNSILVIGPQNVTVTTDDIFKRIMTWNFYKGDGNTMNVRWLKRRVMRFLTGDAGAAPNVDQTYIVSVGFGPDGAVVIRLSTGSRSIVGGALYNRFALNAQAYNAVQTQFHSGADSPPMAPTLKEAIETGALQLPFQNTFTVQI